jgi:hypothetical protein
MIPASERAKTVHALDRAAIVIGMKLIKETKLRIIRQQFIVNMKKSKQFFISLHLSF